MKFPIRLLLVVYWIVFAAVTGYFFGWLGGGEELVLASRLRTGAPKADGRILSVRHADALNSASVNYSYQVGGRQYFAF